MSSRDLAQALDELVHAAAEPRDDGRAVTVLSAAVLDLERATGARLGPVDGDDLVLLQRRLGRVHRLLLDGRTPVDPARVRTYLDALVGRLPGATDQVLVPAGARWSRPVHAVGEVAPCSGVNSV